MISKEEVQHIAKLARLELTEEEIKKMQKDLSAILDYFNVLKKVPKESKVSKNTGQRDSRLRKDEFIVRQSQAAGDLVNAAPEKKDGYIKVKAIL